MNLIEYLLDGNPRAWLFTVVSLLMSYLALSYIWVHIKPYKSFFKVIAFIGVALLLYLLVSRPETAKNGFEGIMSWIDGSQETDPDLLEDGWSNQEAVNPDLY